MVVAGQRGELGLCGVYKAELGKLCMKGKVYACVVGEDRSRKDRNKDKAKEFRLEVPWTIYGGMNLLGRHSP